MLTTVAVTLVNYEVARLDVVSFKVIIERLITQQLAAVTVIHL